MGNFDSFIWAGRLVGEGGEWVGGVGKLGDGGGRGNEITHLSYQEIWVPMYRLLYYPIFGLGSPFDGSWFRCLGFATNGKQIT